MKKIVKSFIALLCIVLTLANCSSVFASEKALSIDNINTQQIQTYHVYKPDKSWDLSKKSYSVDGVVCFKRLIHHDMSKSLKTYKATKQKGDPHEQTENNRPV